MPGLPVMGLGINDMRSADIRVPDQAAWVSGLVAREGRVYGCAKRGCDAVNPDWASYGAYGKSWCLNHPPLRIRIRRWLGEDV